ncbi:YcxB family protein [Colwellia psychrerythraea]|uniref:YcxB-like protein n=1 Tax=Colwellia psychrerythraea TaxID=28229 RepID=A0A099KHY2_COLPS|nr:YcxB family protein [Colwellia psychrerythraea]KGJ90424.1 YcxB-like protein [Colwellia psychrerythraea]
MTQPSITQSNSFSASFTLDKAHYSECYSQSSTLEHNKKTYFKANILTVFGLIILLFTPVNPYAAWFVIACGILETLSVYYHKPWWVMRQMLSKASGSEVTLTVDEQGILTESFHINSRILWTDVTAVTETELGFVIYFSLGKSVTGKDIASKSYISKSCLSDEAKTFIANKKPMAE